MRTDTWDELENFVRKESGVFPNKTLEPDTSLEDDLDITGDDSVAFMQNFFRYFQVDVGDFHINRYFLGEGGGLLELLISAILKKRAGKLDRIPLTLRMLENAIALKVWNTERIEDSV